MCLLIKNKNVGQKTHSKTYLTAIQLAVKCVIMLSLNTLKMIITMYSWMQ